MYPNFKSRHCCVTVTVTVTRQGGQDLTPEGWLNVAMVTYNRVHADHLREGAAGGGPPRGDQGGAAIVIGAYFVPHNPDVRPVRSHQVSLITTSNVTLKLTEGDSVEHLKPGC